MQEQAKTQFYLDLYADDIQFLEHLIDKLGNEPAREEKAVWRSFSSSEEVFTKRKPSTGANPLELAAAIAYAYEELKFSDASFETKLQSAWTATGTMEHLRCSMVPLHLLTEVLTGDLKAAAGDVIANDGPAEGIPSTALEQEHAGAADCCDPARSI